MVLKLSNLIVLLFSLLLISCNNDFPQVADEDCDTYDFSDCNTIEPKQGLLKIELTINDDNPKPYLKIYDGFIEDQKVIYHDTVNSAHFELYVELNKHYSASIDYKQNNKIITAVDGTDFMKKSATVCDSICWSTTGGDINIKLKL